MLLISLVTASNSYPIILVHGFIGWGRDEMNGYYYWGGQMDLESYLKSMGYDVYSVSVGPISSNWDRAVEMFYQIKGGMVNYGKSHSEKFGIKQFPGKSFEGLYPEWNEDNPVHIIGHSQGGQTARMLEYLLSNSFDNEDSQLLDTSKKGWIKSVTTISTPHSGTTLSDTIIDFFPILQGLVKWFGFVEGTKTEKFYDFDLEQWGLGKKENETNKSYIKRLSKSPLSKTKNFSSWDLSRKGAQEFNDIYQMDNNVHYFSYPNSSTKISNSGKHIPDNKISLELWPLAYMMGRQKDIDPVWHENDGVVNTYSMKYPIFSNGNPYPNKVFDGISEPGVWQIMKTISLDHHKVVGHRLAKEKYPYLLNIYLNICEQLYSLD